MRVEVQAARNDVGLIRAVAEALRSDSDRARTVRSTLERVLIDPEIKTAFDIFGSDLPDEVFEGVFDQPRDSHWRDVDL
jgi:hypothetical protein